MKNLRILMLSKMDNIFCDFAEKIVSSYFAEEEFTSIRGGVSPTINEELCWFKPDFLISFLSPYIIPDTLLNSAKKASINFHPGSPDYPGTGCYNFAIYEKASRYGITCHHMEDKVDTGAIVKTSYFDMAPHESVESLKLKSMNHLLMCFSEIIEIIFKNESLPHSEEKWSRKAFTRKQLDELCTLDLTRMDKDEINLRIRASYYPGFEAPYTLIDGKKFVLHSERRRSII